MLPGCGHERIVVGVTVRPPMLKFGCISARMLYAKTILPALLSKKHRNCRFNIV